VAEATDEIEIWGTGEQTRSFLYIDECVEGVLRLMESDFTGPVNIGSEEMISINNLAQMVIQISGKSLRINNIYGEAFDAKYGFKCPVGVMGRNSDNRLIREKLGWAPKEPLREGMRKLYEWISKQ
jgi:nucleoside-diphosphate-sugar epimerase